MMPSDSVLQAHNDRHGDGWMSPFRGKGRQRGGAADLLRRGSIALRKRRLDEAIELLEAAVASDEQSAAGHVNLGTAYYLSERHSQAVGQFEAAVKLKPKDPASLLNLAAAHNALGHVDKAMAVLEQLRAHQPTHRNLNFNLAVAYHRQGRVQDAVTALQRELKLHPGSKHAASMLQQIAGEIAERAVRSRR